MLNSNSTNYTFKITDVIPPSEKPLDIPISNSSVGHCGKCGAPYFYPSGAYWSIVPPSPTPTCNCWNLPTVTFTTRTSL